MKTVLIVDDNLELLASLALLLEDVGFNVVSTTDPEKAVGLCREVNFDVVLCDLHIPTTHSPKTSSSLGGLEMICTLTDSFPTLPIVAMSGFVERATLARMKDMGVVGVLNKPFERELLISEIDSALVEGAKLPAPL